MTELSTITLSIILFFLIALSGFFSASEISMMSLNRYRLRHLVRENDKTAIRVEHLLRRTDKLLSAILIGNTFANIFASAVSTILAVRLYGDVGIAISTFVLTFVVLIFAEISPKTVAARNPQRVAFMMSWLLLNFMRLVKPCIALANTLAAYVLAIIGIDIEKKNSDRLSCEELRTVIRELEDSICLEHKEILLRVLDLQHARSEDLMVPQHEIVGIDLQLPWDVILDQLRTSQYTRLPVYRDNIDCVLGLIHLRRVLSYTTEKKLNLQRLVKMIEPIYCIPDSTSLMGQLIEFRQQQERFAFVVDEYGSIRGLLTLDDILKEIMGASSSTLSASIQGIYREADGSVVAEGSMSIRDLNRALNTQLPDKGPKTLSGLITETLQYIPPVGLTLLVAGYPIEVLQIKENVVKTARIKSRLETHKPDLNRIISEIN